MEPGGFDELDIKIKAMMSAMMDAIPGFDRSLENSARDALAAAEEPLERYALADILEFVRARKPSARILHL